MSTLFTKLRTLVALSFLLTLLPLPVTTYALTAFSSAPGSINFGSMIQPGVGGSGIRVHADFYFSFSLQSTAPIASVTAAIDNVTTTMTYSDNAGCTSCKGYETMFHLGSMSGGLKDVVIVATDTLGYTNTHAYQIRLIDPADTVVPHWDGEPQSILTSADLSSTGIRLLWRGASDNVGVTDYEIYQNHQLVTTVSSATYSYAVQGLAPGTSYTFTIAALDAAGNSSSDNPAVPAPTVNVITPAGAPAELKGPPHTAAGQLVDIVYRLNAVTQAVYAQDVTVSYNVTQIDYLSAEPNKLGNHIVNQRTDPVTGNVRLLLASTSQPTSSAEDVLTLHFRAKQVSTSIALKKAILSDSQGHETSLPPTSFLINVEVVDKTLLNQTIDNAQALYDATSEGNHTGQVPSGCKAILKAAIDKAKAVSANPGVLTDAVNHAQLELKNALEAFKGSIVKQMAADLNNDGKVSIGDLGMAAAAYGKTSASPDWEQVKPADLNHDGIIDIADLAAIATQFTE